MLEKICTTEADLANAHQSAPGAISHCFVCLTLFRQRRGEANSWGNARP